MDLGGQREQSHLGHRIFKLEVVVLEDCLILLVEGIQGFHVAIKEELAEVYKLGVLALRTCLDYIEGDDVIKLDDRWQLQCILEEQDGRVLYLLFAKCLIWLTLEELRIPLEIEESINSLTQGTHVLRKVPEKRPLVLSVQTIFGALPVNHP